VIKLVVLFEIIGDLTRKLKVTVIRIRKSFEVPENSGNGKFHVV